MSTILGIDTAIGLAHWNLRGGWKRTLILTACFTLLIMGIMTLTIQLRDIRYTVPQVVWAEWRIGLLLLQSVLLVLIIASRVAVAIRSDITLRMLESHRLMPIPALTAISGYLWGPVAPTLGIAAANFLLGLFATVAAGLDARVWLGPNLILLIFAVFTWVIALFCGFLYRSAWAGVFVLLIISGLSQGILILIVPALGLLAGPIIGMTVFEARARSYEFEWPIFLSIAAQFLTGLIFYIGAARKYRSSEDSALGIVPGLLLLALWTSLSIVGILRLEDFRNPFLRDGPEAYVTLIISATFLMLVAIAPISNAAGERKSADYSPLVALLCAAVIMTLPFLVLQRHNLIEIGDTWFIFMASLLSICYLLRILYRVTRQAWIIVTGWIAIAWGAPLIIDLIIFSIRNPRDVFEMGILSSMSPIGGLIMLWTGPSRAAAPGVIVQVLLAILWMTLFHRTRRNSHARTGDQTGEVDPSNEFQSESLGADGANSQGPSRHVR